MAIKISDHFTYGRLLRFTAPTAFMMVFTSIYSIVDGLFVSNFVGKEAFSALNLIYPLLMMLGSIGFMLGRGGSALVAKTMGEGDDERAKGLFSMIIYATAVIGVVVSIVGEALVRPVAVLMGAEDELLDLAVLYGSTLAHALPFFMLQQAQLSFLTTAGKPKVGLAIEITAGVTNIVFDAIFIVGLGWGLEGAARATGLAQVVGGVVPIIYFVSKNSSTLRLGKPVMDMRALGKACANGVSELVSNLAMSLVAMLYNYQLMRFYGENGVAAYGVIQYIAQIFLSLFMGFASGSAPLISYHYGARHSDELKSLFRKCLVVIGVAGIVLTVIGQVAARPLAMLFVSYDEELLELTVSAMSTYLFMFLLAGFNIFGSSFFTALNNGVVSAIISFVRTLVFESLCVMVLPAIFGATSIWYAILVAEAASFVLTTAFEMGLGKTYGYL